MVSVVIPTRDRPGYLKRTLKSLTEQDLDRHFFEVVVVDDGSSKGLVDGVVSVFLPLGFDLKVVRLEQGRGANAARNAGIGASSARLVVIADDDIIAPSGWLKSYLEAAAGYPQHEAFGGPIRARLENPLLHLCGREKPPITTLDLGQRDIDTERVWSANMAVRRGALERVGSFDESYTAYGGQEEEWEERLIEAGGKIKYVAAAWVWHWRNRRDSSVLALSKAAFSQGRGLRDYDRRRDDEPAMRAELRVLAGCLAHTLRFRCSNGIIMAAHTAGRIYGATKP